MKRIVILLCAFSIAAIVSAQPKKDKKPDFSGVWTEVSAPGRTQQSQRQQGQAQQDQRQQVQRTQRFRRPPGSLGSGWGKQFTIVQTEDGLTVERVFFARGDMQPVLKYRYSLDGSETRNTIMMGRGIQEQVSMTAWDGEKLVIKTIYTSQNTVDGQIVSCEVKQILSLLTDESSPGNPPSLVVETTRGGVLGGPPSTTRTVYSKN